MMCLMKRGSFICAWTVSVVRFAFNYRNAQMLFDTLSYVTVLEQVGNFSSAFARRKSTRREKLARRCVIWRRLLRMHTARVLRTGISR
jgi:hypothetical protein